MRHSHLGADVDSHSQAGSFTGNVDRWQFVTWSPPSTVFLDVGCAKAGTGAPEGDRSHGISIWSTHPAGGLAFTGGRRTLWIRPLGKL
jgi:hypothetical protein